MTRWIQRKHGESNQADHCIEQPNLTKDEKIKKFWSDLADDWQLGLGMMKAESKVSRRVVVIDEEPAFAATLKNMLDGFGYEVAIATDASARDALDLKDSDIVFVDIRIPKLSWQKLCQQLARQNAKAAIVMMGSQFKRLEEAEKIAKKLRLKLIGAIEKPFRLDDLRDILP